MTLPSFDGVTEVFEHRAFRRRQGGTSSNLAKSSAAELRFEWAIEIKMFRPNGDNGKPDGTAIKDILSPFASDRSALSDCRKIAESDIAPTGGS